jgi:hypothetical protein
MLPSKPRSRTLTKPGIDLMLPARRNSGCRRLVRQPNYRLGILSLDRTRSSSRRAASREKFGWMPRKPGSVECRRHSTGPSPNCHGGLIYPLMSFRSLQPNITGQLRILCAYAQTISRFLNGVPIPITAVVLIRGKTSSGFRLLLRLDELRERNAPAFSYTHRHGSGRT